MGGILFIALIDVVLTQKSTSYLNPGKTICLHENVNILIRFCFLSLRKIFILPSPAIL